MKNGVKGFIIGIVSGVMIASTIVAATNTTTLYDVVTGIKIVVDGEELDARDANGGKVEPFVYNGTTYLPVRAVAEALKKEVTWDGVEKVVYLGAKPGNSENWLDVCGPYQYYGEWTEYRLRENEYFTMSGQKYTNGFTLGKSSNWYNSPFTALFNLNGKYNSLSFTVGHVDGTKDCDRTLNIYIDGIIAYTKELKCDEVAQRVTIPLNGALQMKIEMTKDKSQDYGVAVYGFSEGVFE